MERSWACPTRNSPSARVEITLSKRAMFGDLDFFSAGKHYFPIGKL